jgi:hypothetical protein
MIPNHVPKVGNPEKYPIGTKPAEINLYSHGPHTHAPAQASAAGFPQPSNMDFPFGYYPSPYMMPPGWYSQPPPAALNLAPAAALPMPPTLNPAAPAPRQVASGNYLNITDWLAYCDRHPDRCGEDFSAHSATFRNEGYRRIQQLISNRMTIKTLSTCLGWGREWWISLSNMLRRTSCSSRLGYSQWSWLLMFNLRERCKQAPHEIGGDIPFNTCSSICL